MPARWEEVATRLEHLVAGPTNEQLRVAAVLGVQVAADLPAPVAAAVLQEAISDALLNRSARDVEVPETLQELEEELGLPVTEQFKVGTRSERSAWFASRYMVKTVNGLRALQPQPGDVVEGADAFIGRRVISSIGEDGRIYMKGSPPTSAWPNHLTAVARVGAACYDEIAAGIDASLRNRRTNYQATESRFQKLEEYRLPDDLVSDEAARELEDLLESGESDEAPFQRLIERHPSLLAPMVLGHWAAYVIPQQRLGAEHVTDFLVLGINSLGPQWVAVELEAPRHKLLNNDATLTTPVRHGVQQIQDWREWLTRYVSYAQEGLGLWGITNQVPGLVLIGRDDPSAARQPARSQVQEQQTIQIHSWDWLLRQAHRGLVRRPFNAYSDYPADTRLTEILFDNDSGVDADFTDPQVHSFESLLEGLAIETGEES